MNRLTRFHPLRVRVRVFAKAEALTPTLSQWEREKEGRP